MCDEADIAADQEELMRQLALRVRRPLGPEWTGFCANCGEFVEQPLRWCNVECREDWELRKAK